VATDTPKTIKIAELKITSPQSPYALAFCIINPPFKITLLDVAYVGKL
jgi:hypothetical protein